MPALTLFGRISALSLLAAIQAAPHAQPAVPAPQPSDSSFASTASANAPFSATVQASPPGATAEQEGDSLILHQRYQAALEAYSKVEHPSATLWNKMGIAYQMLLDEKNATRCYKESLKIDPNHSGAINNLATLEDARKNYAAAERLYRQALKINPSSARTLKNLGTNLAMQRRYSASSEAYSEALALDPHILDKFSGPTAEARVPIKVRGEASYLSARSCARAGLNDCAIAQLRKAFDEGSATTKQVADDKDFEALRGTPEYERLLAEQQ
jgi:tetratricopeptide (TPR) repeat protein